MGCIKNDRPWPHETASFTLARGGDAFGQEMKSRRIKLARIVTDDCEITLGVVIRDDEDNQVRVAHRCSVLRNPSELGNPITLKRRHEWRLDAICRNRITEMVTLS